MIILKSKEEIEIMHRANKIVHDVLDKVLSCVSPGTSTQELDGIANALVKELGATPTFLGYAGYPASLCVSVNEEIVHGIPGERIIQEGDIVSVDFGATFNGFVGDAARTIAVGKVSSNIENLISETKRALILGIEQMVPGNRLSDISRAIGAVAKENKFGNLKNFSGHGIGKNMHERPHVFNYVDPNEPDIKLRAGMVLALEPMFTLGSSDGVILKDNWTVITKDKSLAAHWEVSIAITEDGPRVLGKAKEEI